MPERPESIAAVAIGGINASNVQRVLFQSKSTFKSLDGVAVVSAIVAAEDPKAAAAHLRELITTPPIFRSLLTLGAQVQKVQELVGRVPAVVKKVGMVAPICHNMTNMVVQNFAANVAVAMWVEYSTADTESVHILMSNVVVLVRSWPTTEAKQKIWLD